MFKSIKYKQKFRKNPKHKYTRKQAKTKTKGGGLLSAWSALNMRAYSKALEKRLIETHNDKDWITTTQKGFFGRSAL